MGSIICFGQYNTNNQFINRDELQGRTFNSYLAKHLWQKFKNRQLQETDIVSACSTGQIHIVRSLVHRGCNVNHKINGWTGLLEICKSSNLVSYEIRMEIVKILIEQNANINTRNECNWTPLLFATKSSNYNLYFLLILS